MLGISPVLQEPVRSPVLYEPLHLMQQRFYYPTQYLIFVFDC